jgi:hypothetical protein
MWIGLYSGFGDRPVRAKTEGGSKWDGMVQEVHGSILDGFILLGEI